MARDTPRRISHALWVSWENQIRNRSMADALGMDLFVFSQGGGRAVRYLRCVRDTFSLIKRSRPAVIVGQNPSIVLVCLLLMLRFVYRYKLVIDAHFAGVVAPRGNRIFQFVLDRLNRKADLIIVTNDSHAHRVRSIGGHAFVCRDPLPQIAHHGLSVNVVEKTVLFVCSYDIDEPYLSVFHAAKMLSEEGFRVFASGKYTNGGIEPSEYPWVSFLGYVAEEDYYRHMYRAEVVLDLTENEDCLVCGAYEAMAAGRPLVTSRRQCLMEYFDRGVIHTDHGPAEIAEAIRTASRNRSELELQVQSWRADAEIEQMASLDQLRRKLISFAN